MKKRNHAISGDEDDAGRSHWTEDKGDGTYSSMTGGNTDTSMMLDFCLRFPDVLTNC